MSERKNYQKLRLIVYDSQEYFSRIAILNARNFLDSAQFMFEKEPNNLAAGVGATGFGE